MSLYKLNLFPGSLYIRSIFTNGIPKEKKKEKGNK